MNLNSLRADVPLKKTSLKNILSINTVPNMTVASLLFFIGCCCVLFCRELTPIDWLLLMALVLIFFSLKCRLMSALTIISLGYLWATLIANHALNNRLLVEFEKKPLNLIVNIVDFPKGDESYASFTVEVVQAQYGEQPALQANARVRLSCYQCNAVFDLGDQLNVDAVLRRPRGSQSWGAFDFEKYALSKNIAATGYIKNINNKVALTERTHGRLQLIKARQRLKQHLQNNVDEQTAFAILSALAIGDRSAFTTDTWRLLRATGLSHVVSISGLHIGLIFLIFRFLARKILNQLCSLYLIIPANYLESFIALLFAAIYAAMAGFSLPTQRALIMLLIYCLHLLSPKKTNLISMLSLTVGFIMLVDPLAILSSSFWLSISAVLLIGLAQLTRKRSMVYFQCFLSLTMAPLAIAFFAEVSLISPLVNLIVVPLISFIVLPWLFFSFFLIELLPWLGQTSLSLLSQSVQFFWQLLLQIEGALAISSVQLFITPWLYLIIACVILVIVLWSVLPNKRFILLLLLLTGFLEPNNKELSEGEFILTVLDVGQGLAIVIETPLGVSIFDTGNRYGETDSAQQIIIPYLQQLGTKRLQSLIVSHIDSDHIGGLDTLLKNYPYNHLMISEHVVFDLNKTIHQTKCQRGTIWQESGVSFEILAPNSQKNVKQLSRNNGSCVLLIKSPWGSVLLPGDIEREVEHQLVKRFDTELNVDVLVLAHHGSQTSSSPAFLQAAKPNIAIASSGYLSRHGHPHSKVVARVNKINANLLNTAVSGSIKIKFSETGLQTTEYRAKWRRFWYAND